MLSYINGGGEELEFIDGVNEGIHVSDLVESTAKRHCVGNSRESAIGQSHAVSSKHKTKSHSSFTAFVSRVTDRASRHPHNSVASKSSSTEDQIIPSKKKWMSLTSKKKITDGLTDRNIQNGVGKSSSQFSENHNSKYSTTKVEIHNDFDYKSVESSTIESKPTAESTVFSSVSSTVQKFPSTATTRQIDATENQSHRKKSKESLSDLCDKVMHQAHIKQDMNATKTTAILKPSKTKYDLNDETTNNKKQLEYEDDVRKRSKLKSKISAKIPDIDNEPVDQFHQYFPQVVCYLWKREMELKNSPNYLTNSNITLKTRATLNDWLIKVQIYLNVRTESLQLSVAIADYFLSNATVKLTNYQLLGIASLFVAVKVVERFPPSASALCFLTEHTYKAGEVLKYEQLLLKTIMFQVYMPVPVHFLNRGLMACTDINDLTKIEFFCLYLFDLLLVDKASGELLPSLRCAGALLLARAIFAPDVTIWTPLLEQTTSYTTSQLKPVVNAYSRCVRETIAGTMRFKAAYEKFLSSRYWSISAAMEIEKSNFLFAI